jgi:hypothetical protein
MKHIVFALSEDVGQAEAALCQVAADPARADHCHVAQ